MSKPRARVRVKAKCMPPEAAVKSTGVGILYVECSQ
jgi:hypothetical protein